MHFQKLDVILIALAGALTLSSLNSKAMGLAWVVVTVTGLWALLRHVRQKEQSPTPAWVRLWVGAALLALLLKVIPTFYWADPWAERHGEMRLALGALGVWGLYTWHRPDRFSFAWIADALTLTSASGLAWVVLYGRSAVTTHPIPWAAAMAMVSACLLAMALQSNFSPSRRKLWLAGGLLALMAVLSSRSRGAYGIVLWWVAVAGQHAWQRRTQTGPRHRPANGRAWLARITLVIGLVATGWVLRLSPIVQGPIQSIQEAVEQLRVSDQSIEQGANSSVGARIYMWSRSLESIQASPWIGLGHDGRKQALAQWAQDAHSSEIKQLGHVHNEYLHQLIDHGVWGLASQLGYLLAWLGMVVQLRRARQTLAALSLGGVAFVHLTSSFSNVNFSHNYYTAALSLFISLSLWMAHGPSIPAQRPVNGAERASEPTA